MLRPVTHRRHELALVVALCPVAAVRAGGVRGGLDPRLGGPSDAVGAGVRCDALGTGIKDGGTGAGRAGARVESLIAPHRAEAQAVPHLVQNHVVKGRHVGRDVDCRDTGVGELCEHGMVSGISSHAHTESYPDAQ